MALSPRNPRGSGSADFDDSPRWPKAGTVLLVLRRNDFSDKHEVLAVPIEPNLFVHLRAANHLLADRTHLAADLTEADPQEYRTIKSGTIISGLGQGASNGEADL